MKQELRATTFWQASIPRLEGYDAAQLSAIEITPGTPLCVTLGNPLVLHSDPLTYDHMGIVRALRELCEKAAAVQSEIWVIPSNDYTITAGLFRLTESVNMANFGYAWNILRTVEQGQTPRSAIRSMGKRIRHVFLEDGVASDEPDRIRYDPMPLGAGDALLADTVQALIEAGYTGAFSAPRNTMDELRAFLDTIPLERFVVDPAQQLVYPMPEFLPPAGHPRVFLRAEQLPALRENLQKPQNALAYRLFLSQAATTRVSCSGAFSGTPLGLAEAKAFYYALFGDEDCGRDAIAQMRAFCDAAECRKWNYNQNGETIYLLAVVYDWCYPLLDEQTKAYFHDAIIRHAGCLEIGCPPANQGSVTGHGPEGQLLRDILAAAIALFDEYPNLYQNAAGRFFLEFIEPRKFVYQMHCFHQGNEYTAYRLKWEMLCTYLFDRIGYPQIFGAEQQETLRHYLYVHRPDGAMLMNGDCNNRLNLEGVYDPQLARTLFLGGNYWKDAHLKGAALAMLEHEPVAKLADNQTLSPVEFLLFNDPRLEGIGREDLPLLHFQPAPKGGMIIRTGWSDGIDSPDVVCELKLNEYWFAGHQHLDAGAFQIYYKGLLASDDGYYQSCVSGHADRENNGYTGYGSLHHYNYLRRTIAHNCMLIHDPEEQFRDDAFKVRANDGGQRLPNRGKEPLNLNVMLDPANGYRTGKLLRYGWDDQFAYLKGDLTDAYSSKVESYQRSFCFLRQEQAEIPAVLLVCDRVVAAQSDFRKTWLCHGLYEPQISGNHAIFRNTATVFGHPPYCGTYGGQLTVDTLLPQSASLTAIGGPGKEAWVDGVNYFGKVGTGQRKEGHGWRLEVCPKEQNREDLFLHALHIGDAGVEPLPAKALDTPTHIGALVADQAVFFGKGAQPSAQPLTITLTGETPVKLLVCDLEPGTWYLNEQAIAVAENGLAKAIVDPGTYTLRRAL